MEISLEKGSKRNTKCYIVHIGPHDLYFSYETLIGYDGPIGYFRRENIWGPTTGRHINEMCLDNADIVDKNVFDRLMIEMWLKKEEIPVDYNFIKGE